MFIDYSKKGFRLPTEAEWERAAIGGYRSEYYMNDLSWGNSNAENMTHDVGTKFFSEYGIYDIFGNVWEWCNDWYESRTVYSGPLCNPTGPAYNVDGSGHVRKGGSWFDDQSDFSYETRLGHPSAYNNVGFRVMLPLHTKPYADYTTNMVLIDSLELHVSKTEITQDLYKDIFSFTNSSHKGDSLPVEMVSAADAMFFCNELSKSEKLDPMYTLYGVSGTKGNGCSISSFAIRETGSGYRLPTISEWRVFAASVGSESVFTIEKNIGTTSSASMSTASTYGLYNVRGNVSEWVHDIAGGSLVHIGGNYATEATATDTLIDDRIVASKMIGFRVVKNK